MCNCRCPHLRIESDPPSDEVPFQVHSRRLSPETPLPPDWRGDPDGTRIRHSKKFSHGNEHPHRRLRGGVAIRGRSMPTAGTPERVTLRAGERAKMPPTPGSTAGPYGDSGIAALMTSDEAACSGPLSLTALSRS